MTENLKGKMGHKMNHFNVGKGHPIEEVKIILHCINFNIPCHNALNACTFVKTYTFFHLVPCPHLPPTKSEPLSDPPPRSLSSWKTIESDFTEKSDPINFPEPIKNRTRIVVKSGPNNLNRTRFHNNSSPITIWNRSDPTAAIRIRFKFVSERKQSSPSYYSGPTGKYGTRYPRKR